MRKSILTAAIAAMLMVTSLSAEAARSTRRSTPAADPAAAFLLSCTTLNYWQVGQRCIMHRKVCTIASILDNDMEIRCR